MVTPGAPWSEARRSNTRPSIGIATLQLGERLLDTVDGLLARERQDSQVADRRIDLEAAGLGLDRSG